MTEMQQVLREVQANGAATSGELSEALNMPVKRISTYLHRLGKHGLLKRGALQPSRNGRPARMWWPK